jgi:hypothetical protein
VIAYRAINLFSFSSSHLSLAIYRARCKCHNIINFLVERHLFSESFVAMAGAVGTIVSAFLRILDEIIEKTVKLKI